MKKSIKLERNGYTIFLDELSDNPEMAAKIMVDQAAAMDSELIKTFGGSAIKNSKPAKTHLIAADGKALLAWLEEQDAPRSERYICSNFTMPNSRIKAALKVLMHDGTLEKRQTTFIDSRGTSRPMQGIFFADAAPAPLLPSED